MDDDLKRALAELKQEIAASKQEILETTAELVRDAQTEVLKAFFSFQEANNLRIRKLEADHSNLDASVSGRVEVLERRLSEIEKRLFMNPPAA